MNLYIYDDFVKKYKKSLNNIEIQLHKLNLNGKIVYLENIKNINQIIKDEINNGIKTIVAVGNDKTFNKVLNATLNNHNSDQLNNLALGIIPVGKENQIAQAIGVKNEKLAGEILLARRVEKIDVGQINDLYFISEAFIKAKGTILNIDHFSIEPQEKGEIKIVNLPLKCSTQNNRLHPQDNLLDLLVYHNPKKQSSFIIKELKITNSLNKTVLVDGIIEVSVPAKIKLAEQKINIIVGKNRNF